MTKPSRKHTPWTDADLDLLRTLRQQGETHRSIATRLGRTPGAVAQQFHMMQKRDEAEGYVHIAGGVTELTAPTSAKANTYVQPDSVLESFTLFEPVNRRPSLWSRIKRWFD